MESLFSARATILIKSSWLSTAISALHSYVIGSNIVFGAMDPEKRNRVMPIALPAVSAMNNHATENILRNYLRSSLIDNNAAESIRKLNSDISKLSHHDLWKCVGLPSNLNLDKIISMFHMKKGNACIFIHIDAAKDNVATALETAPKQYLLSPINVFVNYRNPRFSKHQVWSLGSIEDSNTEDIQEELSSMERTGKINAEDARIFSNYIYDLAATKAVFGAIPTQSARYGSNWHSGLY